MDDALDLRQQRTRQALTDAVLSLAEEQAIADVTMAQLARRAGVHRTTLYQHLSAPPQWLAEVLAQQLDAVRETHLRLPADAPSAEVGQATRRAVLAVLGHLQVHEGIYRRELADGRSPVAAMLSAHFAASARALIEAHGLGPPGVDTPPEIFAELASRWIADGAVGAMTVWLRQEPPRDPEAYWRAHAALLPAWWPR